jgi:hypothetical protein
MMGPDVLVPAIGIVFGIGGPLVFAALCFPSVRSAVVDRLRGGAPRSGEADHAVAAQLAALRSEIYALRTEVATLARALPPNSNPSAQIGPGR